MEENKKQKDLKNLENNKKLPEKKEDNIPMADNSGKLVNSSRSKNKKDREVKDKVTGAEFEGPPY
jgi:hypothetical protein